MFDQLTTLEEIDKLITGGIRESETLEYKRASSALTPRDHEEVAKDVSALANSTGGLLIYGVETDKSDRTKPVRRDDILPENIDVILQVIATHIRQPIAGLRHKTLPIGGTPQALLIDVPQSDLAPHQVAVRDYRYYRRQGPHSVPMAHDLVELYFSRRTAAVLEPVVTMRDRSEPPPQSGGWLLEFRVELENHGTRLGKLAMLRMNTTKHGPIRQVRIQSGETVVFKDEDSTRRMYRFPVPAHEVFYPGVPIHVVTFDVIVSERTVGKEQPYCEFEVHADEMRVRRYQMWLTFQNSKFELAPVVELL